MKVALIRLGRARTPWADQAVADFVRRLPRNLQFSEETLDPEPFRGDVEAVRAAEAARLLGALKAGDRLVAVDERGELPTSEGFASWLDEAARLSTRRLVFAIGGPYGHGPRARDEAWRRLALGRMVLNHELARVVIVEQLYRASTILWGGSYHH